MPHQRMTACVDWFIHCMLCFSERRSARVAPEPEKSDDMSDTTGEGTGDGIEEVDTGNTGNTGIVIKCNTTTNTIYKE